MLELLTGGFEIIATVPDVSPEEPPGVGGLGTVLNWVSWAVIMLGLAGFLASAGYLAFASFTGREINGFKGLVLTIIVCILAIAASTIIQAII